MKFWTVTANKKITVSSTPAAVTANESALEIVGEIIMPISITQFHSSQLFTVVRNLTVDCILGVDCLMQHGTVIRPAPIIPA